MSTGYDEDEDAYDDGAYDDGAYDDGYDDEIEWTEEDEERYQARQREELRRKKTRRRQALSFTLLVLVVLGAGVVGAGVSQGWWQWPWQSDPAAEPSASSSCDALPTGIAVPAETRVTVLNASDRGGLAAAVGDALTQRGYVVAGIGNDRSGRSFTETAQIRYGPATATQAQSILMQVPGAVLVDDGRTTDIVDLALGPAYNRMAPAAEAAAAIAAGVPVAPPGCEPAPAPTTAPATTG